MTWLVCLGECMVELQDTAESAQPGLMRRTHGGDTLNTAVYMARCLEGSAGGRVDYVTALGDDDLSAEMISAWEAEGVGTGLVRRLEGGRPGLYMIRTDAGGDRSFLYWRSASAAREVMREWGAAALSDRLAGCNVFYFSGISLGILDAESRDGLLQVAERVRAEGGRVSFDSNYRPAVWDSDDVVRDWIAKAYRVSDIALPSFEDEQSLFGDESAEATAARLRSLGVAEIVVKRGAEACLVCEGDDSDWVAPQAVGKPLDTTAAGDSFNAAYLVARVLGERPIAAAQAGSGLAAKVVQARGAIVPREVFPSGPPQPKRV